MPASELQLRCSAVVGWLELGNWLEAYNELEDLPPRLRTHPDVLKLYCRVWEAAGKWQDLEWIAAGASEQFPEEPEFVWRAAWAMHMQGFTSAAADKMLQRPLNLPTDAEYCFRIACLFGVLKFTSDAVTWLDLAFRKSDEPDKLKVRALESPELADLWCRRRDITRQEDALSSR